MSVASGGATDGVWISVPDSEQPFCRICLDVDNPADLISPCSCKGSLRHVHRSCLNTWLQTLHPLHSRNAQPLSALNLVCQSCGAPYRWRASLFGKLLNKHARLISYVVAATVLLSLGVVWHIFDAAHQWFGEGQYLVDDTGLVMDELPKGIFGSPAWMALDADTAAIILEDSYGAVLRHFGIEDGAAFAFGIIKYVFAPLLTLASLTFEGWILAVLIYRPDTYAFMPLFNSAHLLSYFISGSISAIPFFTFLDDAALAIVDFLHHHVARLASATFVSACAVAHGLAGTHPSTWIPALPHILAAAAARPPAVCEAAPFIGAAGTALWGAAMLAKAAAALWIGVVRFYYVLMLLACFVDVAEAMVGDVAVRIAGACEEMIDAS